jgi:hypothetical protein
MPAPGFNPMRWDCDTQGCFNEKCRPKIEVFAECFPRNINFGDVDGSVELEGYELKLEWKNAGHLNIPGGQRIAFTKLSQDKTQTIICVSGDPKTMVVEKMSVFFGGKQEPWHDATLDDVKQRIKGWCKWVQHKTQQSAA